MIIVKRHFLLLEVLIALAIVIACAIPLMTSQAFIYKTEKQFLTKLEIDRLMNLLFTDVMQMLMENKISWGTITDSTEQPFEYQSTQYFPPNFPYDAKFHFGSIRPKEGSKTYNESYYLVNLYITLHPTKQSEPPVEYSYNVAITKKNPPPATDEKKDEAPENKPKKTNNKASKK